MCIRDRSGDVWFTVMGNVNSIAVAMLARSPGSSKILGLAIGNGFAAMAGSIIAQQKLSLIHI